jgi:hypothetical protein
MRTRLHDIEDAMEFEQMEFGEEKEKLPKQLLAGPLIIADLLAVLRARVGSSCCCCQYWGGLPQQFQFCNLSMGQHMLVRTQMKQTTPTYLVKKKMHIKWRIVK